MNQKPVRFSEEQISRADSIDLAQYAEGIGFQIKKVSGRAYKVIGCGGLYIDPNTQRWNWFARNKGGGPIQFAMEMEGKTWVEAVTALLGEEPSEATKALSHALKAKKEDVRGAFILPDKASNDKHVIEYLNKTRAIDIETISLFIAEMKLYEDKKKNCVFVGHDKEGVARYGSTRSTNIKGTVYRADIKNSEKKYPFSLEGQNKTVNVFESPIDLMSYLVLVKHHKVKGFRNHMISLGGVCDKALEYYLANNPEIGKVILCLDNDEAGYNACQQIARKYGDKYKIQRHCPEGKDFNEDLVSLVQKTESERSEEGGQASTL